MSELPNRTIPGVVETVEWRLARPEDGPVWVAVTREGRAPLLPHAALTEPSRRLAQDRLERQQELRSFLAELHRRSGQCFLLWLAGRTLGRACLAIEGNMALMWGLAVLSPKPEEPSLMEGVVQSVIQQARDAGVAEILAIFEGSHLPAFEQEGFTERYRYSTMVAATQESDDEREEEQEQQDSQQPVAEKPARPPLECLVRPVTPNDLALLSVMKQGDATRLSTSAAMAEALCREEIAQLMGGQPHDPLSECAFVAEGCPEQEGASRLFGVIQVSRWREVAVITDLHVAASLRKRGIGKALVEHVKASLATCGYPTVIVMIREKTPAHWFFRHVGFRDVQQGNSVAHYRFPWALRDSPE
jgi:N-acetylglutamate synthase-like GNAT family acetyltransferase